MEQNDGTSAGRMRTAAARAKRRRMAEQRAAAHLESRGWLCIEPELAGRARIVLLRHIGYLKTGDVA